jgi:hypothetical protein
MNTFVFRGEAAELRWGYHPAATVKDWTITPQDASSLTVTARVVSSDAFRVSQHPIVFTVPRQSADWTWPVKSLQIVGESLTAVLGPPE